MMDNNTKVLVLDIDGTLTNSRKEISKATNEALQRIMEMGHKVILASGRPTPGMRRYEKELNLCEKGGYLLSYNEGGTNLFGFADLEGNVIVSNATQYKVHPGYVEMQVLDMLKLEAHKQWQEDMKQYRAKTQFQ